LRHPSLQNGGNLQSTLIDVLSSCPDDPRSQVVSQITSTIPCLVDFPVRDDIYIEPTFIVKLSTSQDSTLSSSELATKITTSLNSNKIWLLSSGPGMGKTLATRKMAETLEAHLRDKYLVIRVKPISIDPDDDLEDAIFDQIKNKMTSDEFKRFYDEENIFLIIDSLDELVDDTEKEGIFEFIKSAADLGLNMWIASRPEESNSLTKILQPQQVTRLALKRFKWRERIQLLQGMLQLSAEDCKALLERFQRETKNELTTNPMHLQMLAKTRRFDLTNGNISTLYWNYFHYMAETALTRIEGKSKSHKSFSSFVDARILLLMKAALKKKFPHLSKSIVLGEKAMDELQNVGVVEARGTDCYSFNHQTYVEFLISLSFLIFKDNEMKSNKIEKDLFNEVLLSDNCRQERQFIESFLQQTNLPVCVLKLDLQKLKDNMEKLVENICSEGLFNIFNRIVPPFESICSKTTFGKINYRFLFKACQTNEKLALRLLEEFGGSIQEMLLFNSIAGVDLLLEVIKNNHVYLMRSLIHAGVNFTNPDGSNKSHSIMNTEPLCLAVCSGHVDCTIALLDYFEASDLPELKAVASPFNRILLRTLASFNQTMKDMNDEITDFTDEYKHFLYGMKNEILKTIVEEGSPLRTLMLTFNHLETMVTQGLDVKVTTKDGLTALHIAAEEGADEVTMNFLINKGVDMHAITNKGNTAYMLAAIGPLPIRAMMALKEKSNSETKNFEGKTLLHLAADKGNNTFNNCLAHPIHLKMVNEQDLQGKTVFHYAAQKGYANCVDRLIVVKADPNALDNNMQSPLHIALESGHVEMAKKILCLKNVIVGRSDTNGNTELHIACQRGMTEIVELLLSTTSSISTKNKIGMTPFLTAVQNGFLDIVQVFFCRNSSIFLETDSNGLSAHTIATNSNKIHLASIIQEKMGLNPEKQSKAVVSVMPSASVSFDTGHVSDSNTDIMIKDAIISNNMEYLKQQLNSAGTDLNAIVLKSINLAVKEINPTCLTYLFDNFSEICQEELTGKPILSAAVNSGCVENVQTLLSAKVDVNLIDDAGYSPLIRALQLENTKILEVILNYPGVDFKTVSKGEGFSAAHFAISKNNLRGLQILLEKGVPLNIKDSRGQFPIHHACIAGKYDAVQLIIQHEHKNADLPDSFGATPLIAAAAHGNFDICKYLYEQGAEINTAGSDKKTPLFVAIEKNHWDVAMYLMKNAADCSIKPFGAEDAIFQIMSHGPKELLKLILEKYPAALHKVHEGIRPIHKAAQIGANILEILLDADANPRDLDTSGRSALHHAVRAQKIQCVEMLLQELDVEQIIEQDSKGLTPIDYAVKNNNLKIFQSLFNKEGVDPNLKNKVGLTMFHVAVLANHTELAEYMIKSGKCNIHETYDGIENAIHMAAQVNNLLLVKLLVEAGVNYKLCCSRGRTPLFVAVNHNHAQILKYLISLCGLDPHMICDKVPILAIALKRKSPYVVKILLNHNVDVNFITGSGTVLFTALNNKDYVNTKQILECPRFTNVNYLHPASGLSALHYTAKENQPDLVQLLLDKGAKPNQKGLKVNTALHFAVTENALECVVKLAKVTNLDIGNFEGQTPLHIAVNNSNVEITKILCDAGAYHDICDNRKQSPMDLAISKNAINIINVLTTCGKTRRSVEPST